MSKAHLTKLFKTRYKVYYCERQLGISDMSETTKAIYELIASEESTIKRIVDNKYFSNISISTIKRSVIELLTEDMITATTGSKDKRERILKIKT